MKGMGVHRTPIFFAATGFTFVELMVTVSIVGLLAAVAIPNFKKYQSRMKTTEAKLQLSAIYTAEASFYGSYQIYHTCLNYMGYDPSEFRSTRHYTVGFINNAVINTTAYSTAITMDLNASECPMSLNSTEDQTFFEAGMGVGEFISNSAHLPATSLGDQSSDSLMTYIAGASGIINSSFTGSAQSSAFTIDQAKVIKINRVGY